MQAFRQGDGVGAQVPMRLAPFTLPRLLADALAGVPQLGDQTGLLIFGEGTGDLAHHLSRRIVTRRQIISRSCQQPHPSADEEGDAQLPFSGTRVA